MSPGAAFHCSLYCTASMLVVQVWSRTLALLYSSTSEGVELLGFQSSVSAHGVELSPKRVRAPSQASNFCVQNDSAERKFDCFGWKVTLCNFWGYYTKYYTFNKNAFKLLIYMSF